MADDEETVMHMPRIVTSGDGGGPMGGHAAVRTRPAEPDAEDRCHSCDGRMAVSACLDAARLAEIDARVEAATPGPWEALRESSWSVTANHHGTTIAEGAVRHADAAFIAHARTDIPWLRTQLDAMRAQRDASAQAMREIAEAYTRECGEHERVRLDRDEARAQLAALVEAAQAWNETECALELSLARAEQALRSAREEAGKR